jgi:hypothetical protein
MTDQEKLKAFMQDESLGHQEIASITGHSYNSVKSMLQPNKKLPRWMNLVLFLWDRKKSTEKEKKN